MMDLTAEFYLQTVDTVFVQHYAARADDVARPAPSTWRRSAVRP